MGQDNLVVFKGTADGIVVILDEQSKFDHILECFKQKLDDSKQFFKGSKISLRFKGRALTSEQQELLMELLTHQNIMNISFVHEFEEDKVEYKEDHDLMWIKEQIESGQASLTHFHYGIVRSGHHIHSKGNVVVLGDVNPGGLITAGGHIIILGALKGKVHAGKDPTFPNAFVVANVMKPIQIGIGNVIAQSTNGETICSLTEGLPQMAYIYEEEIYVNQMDSKTLNHMLK